MCGIAGFVDIVGRWSPEQRRRLGSAMADSLYHRGPDQGDVWTNPNGDAEQGLVLAHRRLSVVDLSDAGRQPMLSASGQSVLCYNGEIFNAPDLKAQLGSACPPLRGHSDSEVLLEACEHFGPRAAVNDAIGQFAFAHWDRRARKLSLWRDRLGIKPLYWLHRPGEIFAFASELQALRVLPGLDWDIDRSALTEYFRLAYVPAPRTIYRGVRQLLPGHALELDCGGEKRNGGPKISTFWSLTEAIDIARKSPLVGSDMEATDALEKLLRDAVSRRMLADVPLGAFLSGGIDSSTVVALMQAEAGRAVKTYSIGFDIAEYNEADHADRVADHLGTEHTRLEVTPAEDRNAIPQLSGSYDQPFADSSQIPTYLISKLARQHVTVALTGDGGDEVFAGYNRHLQAERIERGSRYLPGSLRRALAGGLRGLSPMAWDRLLSPVSRRLRPQSPGDKIHKFARVLSGDSGDIYRRLTSQWQEPEALLDAQGLRTSGDGATTWETGLSAPEFSDLLSHMQYHDTVGYLPGDVLTKVDRASMAVALEVRVPLLDHRVVEFGWSLPKEMKIRRSGGKWLLRQVLYRHVPRELVDRPKMGFGVPIDTWLRGPLRDWADDLLADEKLRREGLSTGPIHRAWRDHVAGRANNQHALWTILMYQAWREHAQPTPIDLQCDWGADEGEYPGTGSGQRAETEAVHG